MQVLGNRLVLLTRQPQKYAVIPKVHYNGEVGNGLHQITVPFNLDEVRVLRNLGVKKAPSPIEHHYEWPGQYKPMSHQREMAAFATLHPRCFIFSEPGTGKTLSTLWAADYLMRLGKVRRVLILCPLSIMSSAWLSDINRSILHRTAIVAHHAKAERRIEMIRGEYEFVILNYDGLPLVADAVKEDGRFDLIIADEANAYKNSQTLRWKTLNGLLGPNTLLWMLTGTPASQSPLDAYGLAKLVNPGNVPRFWTAWRDMVMNKVGMFKWIPKADAKDKVFAALQPAIRFTKAECMDLPPVMYTDRDVPLTPQQTKYYNLLREQMLVTAAGEQITAVNAAAGVNKLLQISAGAAYTDNKEVVEFDCSPRLKVLMEVLNDTDRSLIVFAPYRHSIDTILEHLRKEGVECAAIHGDVSVSERTRIFDGFQRNLSPRVLVIQPQAAAHGVTLTRADTIVFWGPVTSTETYIQCIGRADRMGQTSDKVTVVHLIGSDIERRMYKVLKNRVSDHNALVDLYKQEIGAK